MQLNEAINHRRKALNMSVDDLVKESGVPKGTLSKITAGINANPTLSTVKAICNALGCTLNDLVCDIESSNEQKNAPIIIDKSNDDKQKLLHNYESLNNTGKNKLLEYSDDLVASGKYSDTITITEVARTNDNRKSLTERQVTAKELEIFDIAPQSDEEL